MPHSAPTQLHFRGEAKTVSHPLTCPESRKWSASLLLGYVWSWLLPTDGAVWKHPRRYTFVFFSAFFPVRCPGQLTLKTTRNQVPYSLSWTGPRLCHSISSFACEAAPNQTVSLDQPPPHPSWLPSAGAAFTAGTAPPYPAAPSLPLSAAKPQGPSSASPACPWGAHFLPLMPY